MFASLADLVQAFESGGNYSAVNPNGGASGAYQFVPSSWLRFAGLAGVNTAQYPSAASAPPAVQDQVFAQAVATSGLSSWTCPGCNPQLSAFVSANPDAASLPTFAGGGASGTTTAPGGTGGTTTAQNIAQPSGASCGLSPTCWLGALGSWAGTIASRAGLILLAIILLIGGVWLLATRTQATAPAPAVP